MFLRVRCGWLIGEFEGFSLWGRFFNRNSTLSHRLIPSLTLEGLQLKVGSPFLWVEKLAKGQGPGINACYSSKLQGLGGQVCYLLSLLEPRVTSLFTSLPAEVLWEAGAFLVNKCSNSCVPAVRDDLLRFLVEEVSLGLLEVCELLKLHVSVFAYFFKEEDW